MISLKMIISFLMRLNQQKDGTLKLIEEARASLKRQFDRKEQNPAIREDENDFVWKLKAVDLQVKSYKILDNEFPTITMRITLNVPYSV